MLHDRDHMNGDARHDVHLQGGSTGVPKASRVRRGIRHRPTNSNAGISSRSGGRYVRRWTQSIPKVPGSLPGAAGSSGAWRPSASAWAATSFQRRGPVGRRRGHRSALLLLRSRGDPLVRGLFALMAVSGLIDPIPSASPAAIPAPIALAFCVLTSDDAHPMALGWPARKGCARGRRAVPTWP